jgi:MFS family permease
LATQADSEDPGDAQQSGWVAFRYADFRNFFLARFTSRLAVEMQITAVGWQVYSLTGNPLDLGLVGLAQIAPFLILFPLAGVVADRFARARIISVCVFSESLCAAAFFVLTLLGVISFPVMLAILALFGVSRAFQTPAEQAIVPLLVPHKHVANAIAWTSVSGQTARITGPGIAGLMIIAGEQWVYGSVVILMAGATVFAMMIRANTQIISTDPISFANVFAGMRFIFSRKIVLGAISLDLFAVLLGGATALLPIYAKDILLVGPLGFGILRATVTVGALTGALYFTQRPIQRRAGIKLLGTVAAFGAATIVFGISESFWLTLVMLFIIGATDSVSVFIRNSIVQIVTPDEIRGRTNAVNSVFIGASNELGEFESGVTAAWWGVVPSVVIGGIGTICVALVFARIFPQLRDADSLIPEDLIRKYR